MLLQHLILIPEILLSRNDKVDTSLLPPVAKRSECTVPRSDDERQIRQLWAELLDKQEAQICCDQSFFTQGGNSLLAMRLVHKINLATGLRCAWKISITTIRFRKWRHWSLVNLVGKTEKKGRYDNVD